MKNTWYADAAPGPLGCGGPIFPWSRIKGGTLTTSIFGCPNTLKWVTLSNRAWFKDEKKWYCLSWSDILYICIFRSKYGKIRHFWYDVIFFYLDIFENGFLYGKVLIQYFQNMYRFNTIQLTVDKINAFEISKKVLTQQKIAFFGHFECIYLVNGMSRQRY